MSLASWQGAETTLGRPRATERAASQVTERLGVLLQALDALDAGAPDGVREVAARASEAGHADVASLLELLLLPKGSVDPTRVRREAKARGAGDHAAAWLDLLRLVAAWRAGRPGKVPSAVRRRVGARPCLDTLCEAVAEGGRHRLVKTDAWPSERARQVAYAALHLLEAGHLHDRCVDAFTEGRRVVSFPRERWPDLHEDPLLSWARATSAWGSAQDAAVDTLLSRAPAAARSTLASVLRRISLDVAAGRVGPDLLDAVERTAELARRVEPTGGLARQLRSLALRLSALAPGPLGPDLAHAVWGHRARLRPAEQVQVAEVLLAAAPIRDVPAPPSALALLAAHADSPEEAAARAVDLAEQGDAERWVAGTGIAEPRATLLRAVVASRRRPDVALDLAEALLARDAPHEACVVVAEVREVWGGRREPRVHARLAQVVDGLASHAVPARAWARLLEHGTAVTPRVAAAVDAAVAASAVPDLGDALAAAIRAGRPTPPLVARMGRELRSSEPDAADDLALAWVAAASRPPAPPDLATHAAPVVAFLVRDGGGRLASAVERVQGGPHGAAVVSWLLGSRGNAATARARRRAIERFLVPPGVEGEAAAAFAEEIDRSGATGLGEVIRHMVCAMVDEDDDEIPW